MHLKSACYRIACLQFILQMSSTRDILFDQLSNCCADGPISYCEFIDKVLYTKKYGYYTSERKRVGRGVQGDFYTAESLGSVFAELVVSSVQAIIGESLARESCFIEIAAEPGADLLSHIDSHPFAKAKVIRHGQKLQAQGPVIIFANEWLDALPFHRLIYSKGNWRERAVNIQNNRLVEVLLDELTPAVAAQIDRLPERAADGYEIDLPLQTESALKQLLSHDWSGLILFFDYGKTWQELAQNCPNGTARSYYKHRKGSNLLNRIGEQDITCDVNWSPLEEQLINNKFKNVTLQSQESFFVHHGQKVAEIIVSESPWSLSRRRQTLMELIHPSHMGQHFQALWGIR